MAVNNAREAFQVDDPIDSPLVDSPLDTNRRGGAATDRRAARQSRARRAVLRFLAVWSWVAAMALIAHAFAPPVS